MNHGKGHNIAVDNATALAGRWLQGSEFTEILDEGVFFRPKGNEALRELILDAPPKCQTCGGSGTTNGQICANCGGSGQQLD